MACAVGILLQAFFTKVLAAYCHYLIANLAAIGLAGFFNFALNHLWTFAELTWPLTRRGQATPRASEMPDQAATHEIP
jgi:putative flippase GtrA